ncbi:MAG: HAMP domain-containing protein [Gammaproteobacteria bacterium]|nr:HAMP domain-containing protein [Gammaproteobacteria bacterium]
MAEGNKVGFGIFHKVLLTMVLIAVIPLVAVWYLNYLNNASQIAKNIDTHFNQGLNNLSQHVDGWVDMNRRMLQQNARLPDVRSMDADRQNPIMKLITGEYDWNYLAFTVDPQGQNIGRSDGKKTRYYGDRVYVKQVLDGSDMGKQVLIGKTSGKPALVMSVPIKNDSKELQGVLAIAMTIAEVSERVTSTRIGKTGFAFLVDESGKIIAHPAPELRDSRKDLSSNPDVSRGLALGDGKLTYLDERGQKVISRIKQTADGWLLVIQQDYAEAYASLDESNRNAVLMLVVTILLVIVVSMGFSRRLSQPILQLTEAAEAVSRGQMDVPIEGTERGDEIGLLANAISRLRNSTRLAINRLARKSKAQKQAAP